MEVVIAGNFHQYQTWLRETGKTSREAVYADTMERVMGLRGKVVCFGTYWENPLYDRLSEVRAHVEKP